MQCSYKRTLIPLLKLGRGVQNTVMPRNALNNSSILTHRVAFLNTNSRRWNKSDEKISRPNVFEQQSRDKKYDGSGKGPVSWVNFAFTSGILVVLYVAYHYAKGKKEMALERERQVELGKAKIGGTFDLIDQDGNPKKSEDFHGDWVLLYFGFTHCPDICPDEMEKMAETTDKVNNEIKKLQKDNVKVVPLFITVDPDRDGVKEVKEYIKEFHPDMIGLTGTPEKVKEACKAYRVYFSAGPRDDDEDYIVDHTIIIYLIDPEGNFVDYFGQTKTADTISSNVLVAMTKYYKSRQKGLFSFS